MKLLAHAPDPKVTPIWMERMVDTSPLPHLKYSLKMGTNTPKLYMTPSPMRLPMKHAKTAIQPQKPPSGAVAMIAVATHVICKR